MGKNSSAIMAPNTKPPMCAKNATPPPVPMREDSEPTPLKICRTNHAPRTTNAGRYTAVMKKKMINVYTRRRGNMTR